MSMKLCHAALIFFVAFFWQLVAVYAVPPSVPKNGERAAFCSFAHAGLLFKVDQRSDFSFSAGLALPRLSINRGQYQIWIQVAEYKEPTARPSFVRTGLLWWKPNKFILQPYVETEKPGPTVQTLLSPPLPEDSTQEHEFRLTRTRNDISAYLDSKRIFAAPWYTYFRDDMHIYLRIASEVVLGGDAVSGTVRDIELSTPKGKIEPYTHTIADEDRGVAFVCKDHTFVATGTFDSEKLTAPRWFPPPPCENK
jgi:hypothetical protein